MKYSRFRRDVKLRVLTFSTSGQRHNVLYMRSDVSKEMSRFRLPSSRRRRLCLIWRIRRQVGKFGGSFIASKRPFWWTIFRNTLPKFQRVHIFMKSRKARTAQSTKMADGIYAKLHIFNRPVQKEGNLPGFHIHAVCNLHFDHSSELKVILK